jgi:hypothetical protein
MEISVNCEFTSYSKDGEEVEDGCELKVTATATGNPYIAARLSGNPDHWSPEEGGEIEDIELALDDGTPLTTQEFEALGGNMSHIENALACEMKEADKENRAYRNYLPE